MGFRSLLVRRASAAQEDPAVLPGLAVSAVAVVVDAAPVAAEAEAEAALNRPASQGSEGLDPTIRPFFFAVSCKPKTFLRLFP